MKTGNNEVITTSQTHNNIEKFPRGPEREWNTGTHRWRYYENRCARYSSTEVVNKLFQLQTYNSHSHHRGFSRQTITVGHRPAPKNCHKNRPELLGCSGYSQISQSHSGFIFISRQGANYVRSEIGDWRLSPVVSLSRFIVQALVLYTNAKDPKYVFKKRRLTSKTINFFS